MSLLKRLFRGSSYDPLASTVRETWTPAADTTATTGAEARSPIAVAREIMPSLGARLEDESEIDRISGSRSWERVDDTTVERYTVRDEGDVTVSISVADASRVPGPGALEAQWSPGVDGREFATDANPPSPIVRVIEEAGCSAEIAKLADALGRGGSDLTFFTFRFSPTGHTSLTLFLMEYDRGRATAIERIPAAMPPLRDLARRMRSASTARQGDLFPWYTGSPSFKVPTDPIEYLNRAERILDPIANVPSAPSADRSSASWTWSDPIDADVVAEAFVSATTGLVSISFGSDAEEQGDDSASITWTWQPASRTWTQEDLYEDDPVAQAYLARFGHRVTPLLDGLAAQQAHEFTVDTDRAGNASLITSIDIGEESIDHAAAVLGLLRSNLIALRS